MNKLKVAVLCGGRSAEREISLKSGQSVTEALDAGRYDVVRMDPAFDLDKLVRLAPEIDVALIMIHGRFGEDGTLQGMLDLLDVPYQSAGVLGCSVAMDKVVSKTLYRAAGLPVIDDVVIRRGRGFDPAEIVDRLGRQLVVKPATEGSSIGMSMVEGEAELVKAIDLAFEHDRVAVIERRVWGRELTVGVLGNDELEALPVVEITPGEGYDYFDYEAKYKPGATAEVCPAPIPREMTAKVQELGLAAHRALSLCGYSRTDLIWDQEGGQGHDGLFIFETNTVPGMTDISLLPQAAAVAGMDMPALLDRLIELALERKNR